METKHHDYSGDPFGSSVHPEHRFGGDARSNRSHRSQRSHHSRASGASVPTARSHSRQHIEAYRHKHSQMETESAPRQTKDMVNPRTEAVYNVDQTPPVFTTSNAQYGICEHEPRSKGDIQAEPHA